MILKPQDIFILLKLLIWDQGSWSYAALVNELFMSVSEGHSGIKRAATARLINMNRKSPIMSSLKEFLIHGVKYAYPPIRGGLVRGIPTSYAGPPLDKNFLWDEDPPVWPYSEGKIRGYEFSPLYKSVPEAAENDRELYELLVLVDAVRDGRARERDMAIRELKSRIRC